MKVHYNKINSLLVEQKLKKKYLFEQLQITRQTFWNWEHEKTPPAEKHIRRIAKVLNINVSIISDLKPLSDLAIQLTSDTEENEYEKTIKINLDKMFSNVKMKNFQINAMMNQVDSQIYIKDSKNSYIRANKAFINLINLNSSDTLITDISGLYDKNIFNVNDAELNYQRDLQVIKTKEQLIIKDFTPNTEKEKYSRIIKTPILNSDEECIGIVSTFIDMTEQREDEFTKNIFFDSLMEHNQCGIVLKQMLANNKEEYVYFSKKAEEIFTYSLNDFENNPYFINTIIHEEDREKILARIRDSKTDCDPNNKDIPKFKIITKKNEIKWIKINLTWIKDLVTNKMFSLEIISDITEEVSEKDKSNFRSELINTKLTHNGIWCFSEDNMKYLFISDSHANLLGYSQAQIEAMGSSYINRIIFPQDVDKFTKARIELKVHQENSPCQFRIIHGVTGDIRWIEESIIPLKKNGVNYLLGVATDITEDKENEEKQNRLKQLLTRNKDLAIWIREEDNPTHEFCNPSYEQIVTYPIDSFKNHLYSAYEIIVKEDRDRITKTMSHLKELHTDDSFEYKINTSDGKVKSLFTNITWSQDKYSKKWYYLGVTEDITNSQIQLSCFDNLPLGIAIYDNKTGKHLYANNKFCQIYEYSKNDYFTKTFDELMPVFHPNDNHFRYKILTHKTEELTTYSYRIILKNGNIRHLDTKRSIIKQHGRECTILSVEDISDEIKHKEEIALWNNCIDNMSIGVAIFDTDTSEYLYVNRKICSIYGNSKENILSSNREEMHPKVYMGDPEVIQKLKANDFIAGKPFISEYSIIINGETKHLITTRSKIKYLDKNCIILTVEDTTGEHVYEQISSKQIVTKIKEMMGELMDDIPDTIFYISEINEHNPHHIYINDAFQNMLGYPNKLVLENFNWIFTIVHPDDIDELKNKFINLSSKTTIKYRIKHANGKYINCISHNYSKMIDNNKYIYGILKFTT